MVKHLQDHIQFLEQFINNVNALTAKMLKDLQNEYEISLEQSNVLGMLNKEPLTISEITQRQGVNKAAVSRRIKKLIDAKLVKLDKPNLNIDQRLKFITLTDKGRVYLKERNAIMTDIAQDITNDLNSEDIENVRQVLEVINHRIKTYSNHK
ncbi:TPA: MarR family transcriptional regulator [Staphylococcus aureus]|uniref:MarR family winged helix-turn-helix transcriptional regulator n=1 Tax=Staphylococcus aureus TaxID=1280 RepID=UPI000AEFE36E|nr:MarR family transcriptional regulator [Staphylococcus aureus]NFW24879.1 MarR family transcriptional regulator [Staphylococcus aureus]HCW9181294.1 MarR family transcriptional regulator [Staphylococcus aureus]HCY6169814.1 MarR family transcriptional regulator [Staphylococcus aureus]HCY6172041.1 MarR family transcriptional regulator [Staphylococcus aureus]HCY6994060.1 MarR family transcriptional regulator [Staphylococcus aureus]